MNGRIVSRRICCLCCTFAVAALMLGASAPSAQAAGDLVISQVYGGGGLVGATFTNDFVELFNRGSTTITLTGKSVQYAAATGAIWTKIDLVGSIAPGKYFLIQLASGGANGSALPTPDQSGAAPNIGGTSGKVALVNNTTLISGTACPLPSVDILDFVGYGTGANCSETANATGITVPTSAVRLLAGCKDTDNNSADFAVASPPTPRNSSSPTHCCGSDGDSDGLADACDNCPMVNNPGQQDADSDGIGDACDTCTDTDTDGFGDPGFPANTCPVDNCPTVANPGQADADDDGIGDACDTCTDTDSDGFGDPGFPANTCKTDNCPTIANPSQADADDDGIGDACDTCTDTDGDGFGDPGFPANICTEDNCPTVANPSQADADDDGIGDACDTCTDTDSDGFGDPGFPANTCATDNCPNVSNPSQADADDDGIGDECDKCTDVDSDGFCSTEDCDDTFGNTVDPDHDNICDPNDNCPTTYNPGQEDSDTDGIGDACAPCTDADGDGFCSTEDCDDTPGNNSDPDNDNVCDPGDNCPSVANPNQDDADDDGIGDECDTCTDTDSDGFGDPGFPANTCPTDNCPTVNNPSQSDADDDGIGDACDKCTDADSDGFCSTEDCDDTPGNNSDPDHDNICNPDDNCPDIANADQTNSDSDGLGDACDNCPLVTNPGQENEDGDSAGAACDECDSDPDKLVPGICGCGTPDTGDTDSDGILDCVDNCPTEPNFDQADMDSDGTGDACDNCPMDPLKTEPGACGCGNPETGDGDSDGIPDCIDNCPKTPNPGQEDVDTDGYGDACDNCPMIFNPDQADPDGDDVGSACDNCPTTSNADQADSDSNGVGDACEVCPGVPNPDQPNARGQNQKCDNCPDDPDKTEPGVCGCGVPDTDSDSDGTPDCIDGCPMDINKIAPGQCGCGNLDTDTDSDGIADCNDNCPTVPNYNQADTNTNGVGDACEAAPMNSLRLEANPCQGDNGDVVVVQLWMRNLQQVVTGFEAFLEFDNAALTYLPEPDSSYTLDPFYNHLPGGTIQVVGPGQLNLNGSIDTLGDPPDRPAQNPTMADALLATLKFHVNASCQTKDIHYRPAGAFNSTVSFQGNPIATTLVPVSFYLDNTVPTITCPDSVSVSCSADVPAAATDYNSFVALQGSAATDGCNGTPTVTHVGDSITEQTCPNHYTIIRTYKATDACGNTATCSQSITVDDQTAPTVTSCSITGGPLDLQCQRAVVFDAIVEDNCCLLPCDVSVNLTSDFATLVDMPGNPTIERIPVDGRHVRICGSALFAANGVCSANINLYVIASDCCGNTYGCVSDLRSCTPDCSTTITDTTAPDIMCPANVTIECDESLDPQVNGKLGFATATDNCIGKIAPTYTDGESTPGNCGPDYSFVRTWSATDGCGNTSTCEQTITVEDNVAPTLHGWAHGGNLGDGCAGEVCFRVCVNDNCCLDIKDAIGVTAVIVDGYTGTIGEFTPSISEGDGGSLIVTGTIPVTDVAGCSTKVDVTVTATDCCGNTSDRVFCATLSDQTPPVFTFCPPEANKNCGDPTDPPNTGGVATATDNCTTQPAVDYDDDQVTNAPNIIRTWTATDDCGNSSTCVQQINVIDNTRPTVICPPTLYLQCFDAVPSTEDTIIDFQTDDPEDPDDAYAFDTCSPVTITLVRELDFGDECAPDGRLIVRVWRLSDVSGNFRDCKQVIIIQNTEGPQISAEFGLPTSECLIVNGDFEIGGLFGWQQFNNGNGNWIINDGNTELYSPLEFVDPCDGNFSAITNMDEEGTHRLYQDITIPGAGGTLEWTDAIYNYAKDFDPDFQVYSVEVRDPKTDSVLATLFSTQPGDEPYQDCTARSASLDAFAGQTVRIAFNETDNFNYMNVQIDDVCFVESPPVRGGPPVFSTDADSCSAVIPFSATITDCCIQPGSVCVEFCGNGYFQDGPHIDYCNLPGQVTVTGSVYTYLSKGDCSDDFSVKIKARDCCGLSSQTTITATLTDDVPPVFDPCPLRPIFLDCGQTLKDVEFDGGVFDNCSFYPEIIVTILSDTDVMDPDKDHDRQWIIRTWQAEDHCGNTSTCTQEINFNDITPPEFVTCTATDAVMGSGSCSTTISFSALIDEDCFDLSNCDGVPQRGTVKHAIRPVGSVQLDGHSVTSPQVLGESGPLGGLKARLDEALSGNGKVSRPIGDVGRGSCIVTCPKGATLENEANCGLPVDTVNGGCNSVPPVFSPISCGETVCGTGAYDTKIGTRDTDWYKLVLTQATQVTWSGEAEFDLHLGIVNNFGIDSCAGVTEFVTYSLVGPCTQTSVSTNLPAGTWYLFVAPQFSNFLSCGAAYTATVTTDDCGNTPNPCPISVSASGPNFGSIGDPIYTVTPIGKGQYQVDGTVEVSGLLGCPADLVVTITATDCCGNSASCMDTATVTDTTPPVFTNCPTSQPAIEVNTDPGLCTATVTLPTLTATDACGGPESCGSDRSIPSSPPVCIECDQASGVFPVGTTTVTCTATDVCGNTATCSYDVKVNAINQIRATVRLIAVPSGPTTVRCIRFTPICGSECVERGSSGTCLPSFSQPVLFDTTTFTTGGIPAATGVAVINLPCQEGCYSGLCGKDEQHTFPNTQCLIVVGDHYETASPIDLYSGDNNNDGGMNIDDVTLWVGQNAIAQSAINAGCPATGVNAGGMNRDADYSLDGVVTTDDYTYFGFAVDQIGGGVFPIQPKSCDCGPPPPALAGGNQTRLSVPVSELDPAVKAKVDLNGDRVFDYKDLELFETKNGLSHKLSSAIKMAALRQAAEAAKPVRAASR